MRWVPLVFSALLGSGCTHNFLKENTLRSSGTLSNLQAQQVLNNLAHLDCDPATNPNHLNLSTGLVQATDQGSAAFLGNLFSTGAANNNSFNPTLSMQRALVEQWSVNPVTDGEQLETLRIVYQKALHPEDPNADEAIINQIIALCVRYSLLPKEQTLKRILAPKDQGPHKAALRLRYAMDKEITSLDERISLMKNYSKELEKQNKTKEALELQMQIRDLEEKKEFRETQRRELMRLASIPEQNFMTMLKYQEMKRMTTLPKTSAAGPRRSPRAIAPSDASDTTLLILTALQAKKDAAPGYLPSTDVVWESTRNPALVDQAEDQIGRLESLLEEQFRSPWLYRGCKKDVPRGACYVGHYKGCYVWVMPEQYATFREFTQIVLTLGAPNAATEFPAFSPVFSPGLR